MSKKSTAEENRLLEQYNGQKKWHKWGPYLSERQWGTVREDYSENGDAWDYFTHDQARSRVYRWGEDGIAGISDSLQRICFAVTLWNGKDPILKERLFGLTGSEGNHGEDVKELYYYLDNNPSHSYMKHLYKYPQAAFPYEDLLRSNRNRSKYEGEYELLDTGIFQEGKYFDVFTEYAKADDEDLLIKITIHNRAAEPAFISLLPTLWMRNLWEVGIDQEKPYIKYANSGVGFESVDVHHPMTGDYHFYYQNTDKSLFTENESNLEKLYRIPNKNPFVKDAFHTALTRDGYEIFTDKKEGTKFSPLYEIQLEANAHAIIKLRLSQHEMIDPLGKEFDEIFTQRIKETDEFYEQLTNTKNGDEKNIQRQAFAGMLWSKQYYNIDIPRWLNGDPGQPSPPEKRILGRNRQWMTLNNEDIVSMPDKWEYPWYAAWDLAFHCVPLAMLDAQFAKEQLILFLREWYMHPNGQIPAYEWGFDEVNPPVHAWSCMEVYKIDKEKTGIGDHKFLERVFQKLLLNFTWWVNRKDHKGNNVFEGGFLGLDNIGVFDRSRDIPGGGHLQQADGTAWMAMYCLNMLEIALELCQFNDAYEDVATKFFEHFVYIADSLNRIADDFTGAWDEEQGFFYDLMSMPDGTNIPIKVRSLVGLTTLFAVLVIKKEQLDKVPDFYRRLKWFRKYREENNYYNVIEDLKENDDILLSLVPRKRIEKLMTALLDEKEFLSPGGIRSLSKIHEKPYELHIGGEIFDINYQPGESNSFLFGGNSNWRGPIWAPMNYLLILSLKKYCDYYRGKCLVPFPAGSENLIPLSQVGIELAKRFIALFKKEDNGKRPVHGNEEIYCSDPHFSDLVLFYEYFHGDTCRGLGASHQTGWSGLVAELINRVNGSRG
ncbi:MAG: glucosidase [Bacteroidetes bacterium]|nr:glucosidase [Bacteroidota bacterium]